MDQETLNKFSAFLEENKGKRKFNQSVELAINFTGVDFSKQDNRLNLEIKLPNGKGKERNVIVFADDRNITEKANSAGAKVIPSAQLQSIASDKERMKELLNHELMAQPALMPQIARALGQFLGPKNKMPKPLIGQDAGKAVSDLSKAVLIRSAGKYLPTAHCMVGTEKMQINEISANIDEVLSNIEKKVGKQHIRSVFVKLTMSKPMRLV